MKKIGLIGFSTASQSRKTDAFPDLHTINLKAYIQDDMYVRGNITLGEFFGEVMTRKIAPKTSQPSTGEIIEVYEKMLKKYEEIIIIAPRKELSGTYQNSLLAQEMIEHDKERIHVVEVNNVAMCETLCTERAIALIHQGSEVQYILEEIKSLSSSVITYAFPGSLKYLKLSGRVSGTSAIIGEMLNMRTAVKVTDEFVKIDHKGRGEKSCLKYLNNQIKLYQPKRACVSDIKADVEFLESVVALVESHGIEVYFTEEADIVTGTHFGPSSLGIAFY
jgi:DegV family protein with EDD domain